MNTPKTESSTKPKAGPVFLYFGPLTFLIYLSLPSGYMLDIATTYMLKNQLHASATQIATFRLLTAIPLYFAFVFGMTRDLWNPFGMRDRGYFILFSLITAGVYFWMASSPITYTGLFVGMLLVMMSSRLVMAAYQGLLALIGQEHLMSGRLSALWQIVSSIPVILGAIASGYLADHMTPSKVFMLMAGLSLLIVATGFWKPRSVFSHAYDQPLAQHGSFWGNVKRLLKHKAIYPAVLIMFLWSFAPGSNTPLQFYLTNNLHGSDAIYGYFNAIFAFSFVPVFFIYGYLCKRYSLEKLLWWGAIIAVPQMIPLAFIHSAHTAVWLAVPMGLMGGIVTAAIFDLSMRSCPSGLQGTLMMLVDGFYALSYRGGDIVGSKIYSSSPTHGFLYCVIATTFVYALMLPSLLLVPKKLIATADGQANAEMAVVEA